MQSRYLFGSLAVLVFGISLGLTINGSGLPGKSVPDNISAFVYGGDDGGDETGYVGHESEIRDGEKVCTSSSYSGCGGGSCGEKTDKEFYSVGNMKAKTIACSSKSCGTTSVNCGESNDKQCK